MADLYNLFDGIADDDEQLVQQEVEEAGEDCVDSTTNKNEETTSEDEMEGEWTQNQQEAELPMALREAKRNLYNESTESDDDNVGDGGDDVPADNPNDPNARMKKITKRNAGMTTSTVLGNDHDYYNSISDNDDDDLLLQSQPDGSSSSFSYYGQLKRLWTQEMYSPELLPYSDETMDGIIEQIHERQEKIEQLEQMEELLGSNADAAGGGGNHDMNALLTSIFKVDLDRVQFMLNDLLRIRLQKIQLYPLFMRKWADRMSPQEVEFLKGYGQLLERHLNRTVLDHMPKNAWKRLDEPEMIDEPNCNPYVFVQAKETIEIDNSPLWTTNNSQSQDDGIHTRNVQQYSKGTCLIARYQVIQDLFHQGKVELC